MSLFNIFYISKKINKVLKPYIDVEVERLTNNIVLKSIHKSLNKKITSGEIKKESIETNNIYYDTEKINKLKNQITDDVQKDLLNLNNGKLNNIFLNDKVKKSRFKRIKEGVICDVSIDSIQNISLFANVSPTIPIKLVFNDQLNSDIDVDIKEYGINNVIVQVYLKIIIKEQVIMPLSSKRKKIVIREPISIDIIKGEIPKYYNSYLK